MNSRPYSLATKCSIDGTSVTFVACITQFIIEHLDIERC